MGLKAATAEDDNLMIYNGWGTADCDKIPLDA